jgi:hypothetical protein
VGDFEFFVIGNSIKLQKMILDGKISSHQFTLGPMAWATLVYVTIEVHGM